MYGNCSPNMKYPKGYSPTTQARHQYLTLEGAGDGVGAWPLGDEDPSRRGPGLQLKLLRTK